MIRPETQYTEHFSKRMFDITVSLILLSVLSPLILSFFALIIIEHILRLRPFDPLFYHEIRFSKGRPFTLYKFNIFKHDLVVRMQREGTFIDTKNLERNGSLLYVGWLLKQIYLDELPQLINVLRGDMSIVGPRPVNTVVHQKLREKGVIDKDRMKAGMTGHYQASHKVSHGGRSQEELDHEYVEYCLHNPWYKILLFDIGILLRTVKVLILARGI